MITLIVEFNEEIGFWQFIVKEDDRILHCRPGFRAREQAEFNGDAWVRNHLGGIPINEVEDDNAQG